MAKATRTRPRTPPLPGMEHRAIQPLEDVAAAYARVRDQRAALLEQEAGLKQTALKLMKQFHKTVYRHDGLEIRIVPSAEDVTLKVRKAVIAHASDTGPAAREGARDAS